MTDNKQKIEIEILKQNIFSDNWELVKSSAYRLGEIGGDEVVNFLIYLISLDNSSIRNRAALALENIKDNRALEPLLTAIFKKENFNYNGTMVFALESLDCSKKLIEIFRILFYESYEAKISAYSILSDQVFDFTIEDLLEIRQMWEDCKLNPEKCPFFDEGDTRLMIQNAVDGFMCYLKSPDKSKGESKTKENSK